MAFSGQRLSFSGSPDELIPVTSPIAGEPTGITTFINGTPVAVGSSAGLALAQVGPATRVSTAVTPAASPYNVAASDLCLLCSTSGAISIVLPTAATSTHRVIQIVDASGGAGVNNITISVSGGGTINGAASYTVALAYGTVTVMSTGAAWVVLDKIVSSGGGGSGGYDTGVRQIVSSFSGTFQTVTTILPVDGTIPQNTEGAQIFSATITPQSATSNLLVFATVGARSPTVSGGIGMAMFRDSEVNAFAAQTVVTSTNQGGFNTMFSVIPSLSTSATTIKVRMGLAVTGTLYINGYTGSNTYFGGVSASGIVVMEYGI